MMRLYSIVLLTVVSSVRAEELPAPRRVTIESDSISLRNALEKLTEQTGGTVLNSLPDELNPSLNLELKKRTFWEALDQIALKAGAAVQLYRRDGQVELVRNNRAKAPVSYSGLFRVALRKVSTTRDLVLDTHTTGVTLEVAWEPTFEPFYLETRPQKVTLEDAAGKAVEVPSAGSLWTAVDGQRVVVVEASLPALPRTAQRIGLLKGQLPVRGPSRMHAFRWKTADGKELNLRELAAAELPLTQKAGANGSLCSVNRVRNLDRAKWTVQVTVQLPSGGPEFESYQTWYTHNDVHLVSRDGKRKLIRSGYDQENAGTKKAVLNFHFDPPQGSKPEDWFLVCRVPASIVELNIPFEFRGVPLP